jgi:hypothetical protein
MELWKEVYTPEQLQRVQELEMENLQVLKDVCEKMGIRFFAYGGTLIGAVRHKGFVPWDDDLDIMPAAPAPATPGIHTIKPGDTIYRISRQYGVNPADLMKANGLTPETANTIRVGATLRIPAAH